MSRNLFHKQRKTGSVHRFLTFINCHYILTSRVELLIRQSMNTYSLHVHCRRQLNVIRVIALLVFFKDI